MVQSLGGGGAERVARDVANGLYALRNDVAVLTNTELPIVYELNPGIKLFNNKKIKWVPRIISRFCVFQTLKIYKEFQPDIVIGIMWGEALTAKIAMSFHPKKIPVIFSDHDSFVKPQGETIKRILIKRYLSKWCDYYTVLTNSDLVLCKIYNISRSRVMNNPLSLSPVSEIPPKRNVILAVGRLDAWHYKGFDILIKSWGKIAKKYPDWLLEIVGAGSESSKSYLQDIAKECGCQNSVVFSGHYKDMTQKYKDSAVFVLSSRYEGFGLVLTEAMSQGCACIACDYKGRQRDIVTDGVDGLIAKTNDVLDLASKIEQVIRDDQLRYSIQQNAPRNLGRYSIESVALAWNQLINELTYR